MDRVGNDDLASADELGEDRDLDLSPRATPAAGPARPGAGRSKLVWGAVLLGIIGAIAFVISQGLNEATLYYRNADEAVARQAEDFGTPFRLQGKVVEGSKQATADGADFKLEFNGVTADVRHVGAPPSLFQECIPVVVEGRWASADGPAVFNSTEMIIKHDENYEAENSDRVAEARAAGANGDDACAAQAAGVSAP